MPAAEDPTITVEIEFDPVGAPDVWTDVSAYFVQGSTSRGRAQELERDQAGTCTLELRNDDRRFDPSHAAGPYYPNIKPMRRVRVIAAYDDGLGSVGYPVFQGYIESWDQTYTSQNVASATIYAVDGTAVLAGAELPVSVYVAEVQADSPTHWWRLNEPDGQTIAFDSSGNGNDATYVDSPIRGQQGLVSRDPNTSTLFDHPVGNLVSFSGGPITAFPFTLEAVVMIPEARDNEFRQIYDQAIDSNNWVSLWIEDTAIGQPGKVVIAIRNGGTTQRSVISTSRVDDGSVHHIAVRGVSGTEIRMYVDGVEETNVLTAGTAVIPAGAYTANMGNWVDTGGGGEFGLAGYLQDVAVYNTALSAARVAVHADAMSHPRQADPPGTRMGYILDLVDWPAANRDLDTGLSVLQSATLGQTALEHIQKVADSDFGRVFISKDGDVKFIGRASIGNTPGPYTFGEDSGAGELGYVAIRLDYSRNLIKNDVTISRTDGVAQRVVDTSSLAEYQRHSYFSEGLFHDDDSLSLAVATALVSAYAEPLLRVTGIDLAPRGAPGTLFPAALGLELGDNITVKRRPQGVGSAISQVCVVEGISHSFAAKAWSTSLTLSPAIPALGV
ncbi:MAG: LamG-like jellyroll fold domain-containing protein [Actinomycetota bacterium]|jgi:hypothetical protein